MEIWKDIKGYEGLYQISSHGRIVSIERNGTKGGEMKPSARGRYLCVWLHKNGDKERVSVHVLVAKVFMNHIPSKEMVVDHIDNNPHNNVLSNLQIITQRENSSKDRKGENKLTGVSYHKRNKSWLASIMYGERKINLGYYNCPAAASIAYQNALYELNKGSDLNVIYPKRGTSSQYKGVCFDAESGKWLAQKTIQNKQRKIGRYATEIDAYNAILNYILI